MTPAKPNDGPEIYMHPLASGEDPWWGLKPGTPLDSPSPTTSINVSGTALPDTIHELTELVLELDGDD